MNGPEHYREAERLAELSLQTPAPYQRSALAAVAQVHATLALTAATAMQAAVDGSEPGMSGDEFHAWYVAAGVKPIRPGAPDRDEDHEPFSAPELHEMDQADEAALDATAEGGAR